MPTALKKGRVDQLKSFRARSKSPVPSSTQALSKKVLSFRELQELNGNISTKRQSPKPTAKPRSTSKVIQSSPVAIRVRKQILMHDHETPDDKPEKSPPLTNSKKIIPDSPLDLRKDRLKRIQERNKRREQPEQMILPDSTLDSITPTNQMSQSASFFTPSPATTGKKPSKGSAENKTLSEVSTAGSSSRVLSKPTTSSSKTYRTPPLAPISKLSPKRKSTSKEKSTRPTPKAITPNDSDDNEPSTRRNLDKRTARLRYSGDFSAQITKYKLSSPACHASPVRSRPAVDKATTTIYVRKRPMFPHELNRGDFDVCQAVQDGAEDSFTVYRTLMGADMKTKYIQSVSFPGFTCAFDSDVDSDTVYQQAVQPLVKVVLQQATPAATVLLFGQTGSGKTYTMSACQERMARQIFEAGANNNLSVQVQAVELAGKVCRDLIGFEEQNTTGQVKILEQEDGSVRFIQAATVNVRSVEELTHLLISVNNHRSTQSTQQNDVSSRSHAIYQIRLVATKGDKSSVLTLVDCAGTERRNDSIYHSKDRQAESTEINASLYALKECIRKRSLGQHVPYRSNLLTRILRESLESTDAPLAVIATVSPNATDTEHSIETLKTVSTLLATSFVEGPSQLVENCAESAPVPKTPKQWTKEELLEWMSSKPRLCPTKCPSQVNGRAAMRMSKLQLFHAFYENAESGRAQADALFQSLRAETDRVARLDLKRRFAQKNP